MNKILLVSLSFILWSYSCEKDSLVEERKYYDSEIFLDENLSLYGEWHLVSNSGGIIGTGKQIDAEVDLEIERFGCYKIFKDQVLAEEGKVTIITQDTRDFIILFEPEDEQVISLFDRVEKTVSLEGKDLWLTDPCCDLFQYHFEK